MILTKNIKDQVHECGYAFIAGYQPEKSTAEVATLVGKTLKLGLGDPVHVLAPTLKKMSAPNTYSGIYGMQSFPFHTDMAHWRMPPQYLMLRCIIGFQKVPTLLADGLILAEQVGLDLLARAIVRPRRPVKGKCSLLRIYQPHNEEAILRWDNVFLCPASTVGEQGIVSFREATYSPTHKKIALEKPGDTLIINNWRMLHGRASVPSGCEGRKIERVYLGALH